LSSDVETFGEASIPEGDSELSEKVNRLIEIVRALSTAAMKIQGIDSFLDEWIRRTVLNSFGLIALIALQQYSGSNESDIGYAVEFDAMKKGEYRVFLYDRAFFGNGSTAAARRYFHIPNVLRHHQTSRSRLLPSDDFLSTLEEKLLQCPQFHTDMSALKMFSEGGRGSPGIKGLYDVENQAKEVLEVSTAIWERMAIKGPEEAWRLPLANCSPESVAAQLGVDSDDLQRATSICWNGCPECVERSDAIAGGHYLDKAVLDAWFEEALKSTEEYVVLNLQDFAEGKVWPSFGSLHRLRLDLENRRIRSANLPWTIGFSLERGEGKPSARMLMRVSDILDLELTQLKSRGTAAGVESIGFKRLLWFDLVLTAYLDVLGLLHKERKKVKLVYYDCRDVEFDDTGLSPRMIDAILVEARKTGIIHGLRNLSDVLSWLLSRGFEISICVDGQRSLERDVKAFLERLNHISDEGLEIVTKDIAKGSMHKKALITPIGVLEGSANLTDSAATRNEEIVNHFFYGTREYLQLKASIEDTFHGSKVWRA